MLRRGRLGHGERFSTIVRIHRVIHYICNRVIVSGHFMQCHKASCTEVIFFFFLGCCCHRGAKADSQGLSELTHSYYHQLNLSLHSEFIVFQTGESFFYSTLVLVCLHSPCLVILVWIT